MRVIFSMVAGAILLAGVPALGQKTGQLPYRIDFNPQDDVQQLNRFKNKEGLFINVKFTITPEKGVADPGKNYTVVIEEDNKFVMEVPVTAPPVSDELSVVLAMDISGSMNEHGRMVQARSASGVFFNSLPAKADCGLILFNHQVQHKVPPITDRSSLRKLIDAAQPSGGTAYLDATSEAIDMLKPFAGKARAVVLLTDGVDINSSTTLEMVIARARGKGPKGDVRIFTIGIGEPGKQEKVTSVLVLDKSGSMNLPANDKDKISKILALRGAADRFVNSIGSSRRTTILEFSDAVQTPGTFTNNKFELKNTIKNIYAKGETALFDAVYTAVATLEAEGATGKRGVVALTDGIDNSSRRRVDEVIARAREAKVPLYMLGFGRQGELDVKTMEEMANQTGGKFYYAENDQKLMQHFENLSIQLHDDGIDEESLRQLAQETGGQYYAAKSLKKLDFILQQVTKKMQGTTYDKTFPSLRQVRDGLTRHITLKLKSGTGQVVITKEGGTQVRGLVIAEMTPFVYLAFLAALCALIALPAMLKRRAKTT